MTERIKSIQVVTSDWSQLKNSAREQPSDWWNRTWWASCCTAIGSPCRCSASLGLWEPQPLDRWMRAPPPEGMMSQHHTDTTPTLWWHHWLYEWMCEGEAGCRWDQVTVTHWGPMKWDEVGWRAVKWDGKIEWSVYAPTQLRRHHRPHNMSDKQLKTH